MTGTRTRFYLDPLVAKWAAADDDVVVTGEGAMTYQGGITSRSARRSHRTMVDRAVRMWASSDCGHPMTYRWQRL